MEKNKTGFTFDSNSLCEVDKIDSVSQNLTLTEE